MANLCTLAVASDCLQQRVLPDMHLPPKKCKRPITQSPSIATRFLQWGALATYLEAPHAGSLLAFRVLWVGVQALEHIKGLCSSNMRHGLNRHGLSRHGLSRHGLSRCRNSGRHLPKLLPSNAKRAGVCLSCSGCIRPADCVLWTFAAAQHSQQLMLLHIRFQHAAQCLAKHAQHTHTLAAK